MKKLLEESLEAVLPEVMPDEELKPDRRSVTSRENGKKGGRPRIDYGHEAKSFIFDRHMNEEGHCLLKFYRGYWYRHDGAIYKPVSTSFVRAELISYLENRVGASKTSLENVMCVMQGTHLCGLCDDLEEPFCLVTGKELDGFFTFSDGMLIHPEKYIKGESNSQCQPSAEIFTTRKLEFVFDEENDCCPKWEKALIDWLDDEEDRRNLQKYFGYCLMASLKFNKFLACIGAKGTGKSTAGLVAKGMLGKYADVFDPKDLSVDHKRDKLVKYNLLVMEEVEQAINEAVFKSVTSSGELDYCLKFQASVTAKKMAKIMLSANDINLKDKSGAIVQDRMLVLNFDKVQRGTGSEVMEFHEVLISEEATAIFNWSMKGLELLMAEGFVETSSAIAWKESYVESNSPALRYCQENFMFAPTGFMSNAVFNRFYKDYLSRSGDRLAESKADFRTFMIRAFPKTIANKSKRINGVKVKGYLGISPIKQIDEL